MCEAATKLLQGGVGRATELLQGGVGAAVELLQGEVGRSVRQLQSGHPGAELKCELSHLFQERENRRHLQLHIFDGFAGHGEMLLHALSRVVLHRAPLHLGRAADVAELALDYLQRARLEVVKDVALLEHCSALVGALDGILLAPQVVVGDYLAVRAVVAAVLTLEWSLRALARHVLGRFAASKLKPAGIRANNLFELAFALHGTRVQMAL